MTELEIIENLGGHPLDQVQIYYIHNGPPVITERVPGGTVKCVLLNDGRHKFSCTVDAPSGAYLKVQKMKNPETKSPIVLTDE